MILRQQDFRRVTNHASRGQEVRDEARVRDRAPQTARSDPLCILQTFLRGNILEETQNMGCLLSKVC